MKARFTTLLLLAASGIPATLRAEQPGETGAETTAYAAGFSAVYLGDTDFKGAGAGLGGVSTTILSASAGRSFVAGPGWGLDVSLGWQGAFFESERENLAPLVERLQGISASAVVRHRLNEKWSFMGSAGVGIRNSGTGFDSDGLGFEGGAGFLRSFGEDLNVLFGVVVNSLARDNHRIMAGLGVNYRISPQWHLSLGFPETSLTWSPSRTFRFSLVAEGNLETYHVRERDIRGNTSAGIDSGLMEYGNSRAGLRATTLLPAGLELSGTAGYMFMEKFDFFEDGTKIESDGGAPYGSISISAKF